MRKDHAVRLVANLRRYRPGKGRRGSKWDASGPRVPNDLMPKITKALTQAVDRIMMRRFNEEMRGKLTSRIEIIDPHNVWTFQRSLRYRSLMWQVKNFDAGQRRHKEDLCDWSTRLPVMLRIGEKLIVWNGNHRTTAALILGRRLRCRVWRLR